MYAAYRAAVEHKGAPTVILAQTVKGYTLGTGFESRNANHQMKKLTGERVPRHARPARSCPIPDSALDDGLVPYGHPGADSPEVRYLQERRAALGGPAPARRVHAGARCPSRRNARSRRWTRAPASRRSPPPWRSSGWSRT